MVDSQVLPENLESRPCRFYRDDPSIVAARLDSPHSSIRSSIDERVSWRKYDFPAEVFRVVHVAVQGPPISSPPSSPGEIPVPVFLRNELHVREMSRLGYWMRHLKVTSPLCEFLRILVLNRLLLPTKKATTPIRVQRTASRKKNSLRRLRCISLHFLANPASPQGP